MKHMKNRGIPYETQENHETQKIPFENYENHKKIMELQKRIMKIMKIVECHLKII